MCCARRTRARSASWADSISARRRKAVFDAHPEWFFRQANGEPVIYNGLYSTCINGGYYREQAMKILAEALEKYDVDGLFFNMFGNQSRDYSGRESGCAIATSAGRRIAKLFRQRDSGKRRTTTIASSCSTSSREVAAAIGKLIREKRPSAGYFNYIQESTDGIMSESNTAVARPLPLWPYSASDNVNRARNSQPGKMAVNLNMQFVDYCVALRDRAAAGDRAAVVAEHGQRRRADVRSERHARPAGPAGARGGEADLPLGRGQRAVLCRAKRARRACCCSALQRTPARVYAKSRIAGMFRLLTEEHIPFAVSDNMEWLGKRDFDLVIATDWAPAELQAIRRERRPGADRERRASRNSKSRAIERTEPDVKGYIRVRDHAAFPSLKDTDLLMLDGPFTVVKTAGPPALTLIPPSMIGPPEFIHIDMKDTDTPAIATERIGKGTVVWIPWNLGGLYYRHSLPAHAGLFRDVFNSLDPHRQIQTNAHPLVEMTLMRQGARTLLHLINLSGHSQTGYFAPLAMDAIRVRVAGSFHSAKTVRSPGALAVRTAQGYTEFTVPRLSDYELVVLE